MESDAEEEEMEESRVNVRLLEPDTFPEDIKQQKQDYQLLAYLQCCKYRRNSKLLSYVFCLFLRTSRKLNTRGIK